MNKRWFFVKQFRLTSLMAIFVLALAACAPAATPIPTVAPTETQVPTAAPTTAPTAAVPVTGGTPTGPAMVNVATDAKLGQILVDSKGNTLYMFTKDTPDTSNCKGGCAKAWPAFLTLGAPQAGAGVDASMLGTAKLADGSSIVTYNHMPLYYYAADTKPGDTNGQDVGKVWFVVSPDGKPVGMQATPAAGSQSTTAPAATAPAAGSAGSASVSLNVANNPAFGQILVDGKGMTLYAFKKDTADKSNCSAGCLKVWPPFSAQGSPTLGAGVDDSKVGSATLADGSTIVTYNHMPLYYYASDANPGDVMGQGVGTVWFVVSPDGKMIETAASAPAQPAAPTVAPVPSGGGGGGGGGGYSYP